MALLSTHLRRRIAVVGASAVAIVPTATVQAEADTTTPGAVFYTPLAGDRVDGTLHVLLGAPANVTKVVVAYGSGTAQTLQRKPSSDVFETTSPALSGTITLTATAEDANGVPVGTPATETVTVSSVDATDFSFVRPRVDPAVTGCERLGVFQRNDGHAFTRASGFTTRDERPTADAPSVADPVVPASALPAPTGTLSQEGDPRGQTYRVPVDLTGNPGLSSGRAVIRVRDSKSSAAVEAPLYSQTIRSVTSKSSPVPGTSNVTITARVTDQCGSPVVGAPIRLRGFVNGSPTPVSEIAVSDAHDGLVTFTNGGAGYPTGFYVPYVDLNLNGFQSGGEPAAPQIVVGTVTRSAPGRALYHDNRRTRGAGGTVGDSLRGTRAAAARHYQWIDQNGQLAFTSRAVLRAGANRVTQPTHLTWVNAHGAPYNPRWLKRGRFETRAWSTIRRRPGLRNADMTFQQNAAYGLSVEWEVKDIKPFTSAAALNAAFASLAASAQRYYGPSWQSRVQIKMLSNLSGGLPFALRVLRYAHAHGFTTMLLARNAATRTQIPASAHNYVNYVRGAQSALYPTP